MTVSRQRSRSALPLLVARFRADDAHDTVAPNDLAVAADLFYRSQYFHRLLRFPSGHPLHHVPLTVDSSTQSRSLGAEYDPRQVSGIGWMNRLSAEHGATGVRWGNGVSDESIGFGKKDLPQLQDHSAQRCRARHLHGTAPQAAARLIGCVVG